MDIHEISSVGLEIQVCAHANQSLVHGLGRSKTAAALSYLNVIILEHEMMCQGTVLK